VPQISWNRSRVKARGLPGRGRGQALVEFALVLPLLLLVAFGIFEFGFITNDQIVLANAARDGARTGSLSGTNEAAAISEAQADFQGLILCPTATPAATYTGANPQTVTVTVSCTYHPVTPLGSLVVLLGHSLTIPSALSSSTSMRVEQ